MSPAPASFDNLIAEMTPEIHASLKQAVELGRWDNGDKLSDEQREHCMQAVIAYDLQRVSVKDRVAYIDRSKLNTKLCDE